MDITYIHITTNKQKTWKQLREDIYRGIPIPEAGVLKIFDYRLLEGSTVPTINEDTEKIVEIAPTIIDGRYYRAYSIESLPVAEALLKVKTDQKTKIAMATDFNPPKIVNGITYNGGEESATAIQKAIDFAKMGNNPVVHIWDIHDKTRPFNILEAEHIVLKIGEEAYNIIYAFQSKKSAINEIEINETYPTLEDAVNAIRNIS